MQQGALVEAPQMVPAPPSPEAQYMPLQWRDGDLQVPLQQGSMKLPHSQRTPLQCRLMFRQALVGQQGSPSTFPQETSMSMPPTG
jgi:hypothetical protein